MCPLSSVRFQDASISPTASVEFNKKMAADDIRQKAQQCWNKARRRHFLVLYLSNGRRVNI